MPWSMPSAGSVEPTGVGEAPVLSAAQLRRWSQEGWLCVQGLMPPELLEQASEQAAAVYPPPSAVAAPEPEPLPYDGDVQKAFSAKDMKAVQAIMAAQQGSQPTQRFPMNKETLSALNLTSLEPRLLAAAAQLLFGGAPGSEHHLLLARSDLVAAQSDDTQPLQSNNMTHDLVPQPANPDAVEIILFFDDSEFAPGSALIMRTDLGFAGQPVCPGTRRLSQHFILRKREAEYVQSDAFIRSLGGYGELLGAISPAQRSVLGFPPPGHPYWRQPSALALAIGRYPHFDPTPYVECDNGAPADFMEQWQAGAGHPARGEVANRAFDSAYGYEGERLAPPQLAAGTGDKVLSDEQVQQWRELGYVFVSGIWPDEVMDAAAAAAADLAPFPNPDGTAPPPLTRGGVFGNGSTQGIARPGAFPYHRPELSAITLHPRMLRAISQLLDAPVDDLRLTQSMVGGKYGGKDLDESEYAETFQRGPDGVSKGFGNARGDQGMHNDFGNNTVLFPARNPKHWEQPEEVQSILYYNDFDGESSNYGGGGTAFAPGLAHTLDGRLDSSKDSPPERNGLYSVERQAAYTKGSVFLYSLGTWHRGTPVEPHGIRRIQFNCYKKKQATWVGGDNSVGSPSAKSLAILEENGVQSTNDFLAGLAPEQRAVIGFPAIGDDYWTPETLAATAARYPDVDMAPYAAAVQTTVQSTAQASAKL